MRRVCDPAAIRASLPCSRRAPGWRGSFLPDSRVREESSLLRRDAPCPRDALHSASARNRNRAAAPSAPTILRLHPVGARTLARVSARQLEPMLDEFQRPLAASLWQELCATMF